MKTATLNGMTNAQLFDALMNRLSARFTHIPNTGVIAGQAVASACYDILNIDSNAPMRDLDVFMNDEQLPKQRIADFDDTAECTDDNGNVIILESRSAKLARHFGTPQCTLEAVSHGAINLFADRDGINSGAYTINGSYIDREHADTNYIHVIHATKSNRAMNIVNGFDINACQIAIDMDGETVAWTDAFEQFLNDRVLRVTFFGTPMHSAVRLCKKRDDLSFATVDLHGELRALATMRAFVEVVEDKRANFLGQTVGLPGQLFSNVYAERFKQYEAELSPYFELTPRKITVTHTYTVQKNDRTQESVIKERDLDFFVLAPKQHDADNAIYGILHCLLKGRGYSEVQNLEFAIQTFGTIEQAKHSTLAHSRLTTLTEYTPTAICSFEQAVLFADLLRNLDNHYFPSPDEFKEACEGHKHERQLDDYQLGRETLKVKIVVGINLAQLHKHKLYAVRRSGFAHLLDESPGYISLKLEPSVYLERAQLSHQKSVKALRALRRTPQLKNTVQELAPLLDAYLEELVCPNRIFEEYSAIYGHNYMRIDFENALFVKLVSGDTHALYRINSNAAKKKLSVTLDASTDNRIPDSYGEALELAINLHWTLLNCEHSTPSNSDLTELALKLKRLRDGQTDESKPVFEDDIPF